MEFVSLGKLTKAKIRHDNSGLKTSWFLDHIDVIDEKVMCTSFLSFVFIHYCYLHEVLLWRYAIENSDDYLMSIFVKWYLIPIS